MNKLKIVVLIVLMMFTSIPAFADEEVTIVTVNLSKLEEGATDHTETIVFTDAKPFIDENGRTQIPVRAVSEELNASVKWYADTKEVRVQLGGRTIMLAIDSNTYTLNDVQNTMDTAAVIKDGRTYVPLRFVAEALGAEILWDGTTKTVTVKHNPVVIIEEGGTTQVEIFTIPVDTGFVAYESDSSSFPKVYMYLQMLNPDYEEQKITLEATLLQGFDKELVDEVMLYVNSKTDRYTNLEYKSFEDKNRNRIVSVESRSSQIETKIYLKDL